MGSGEEGGGEGKTPPTIIIKTYFAQISQFLRYHFVFFPSPLSPLLQVGWCGGRGDLRNRSPLRMMDPKVQIVGEMSPVKEMGKYPIIL